jgi:hypothetical protein
MAITIHEFSTGIRPDGTFNAWVSRGFTSRFMNGTVDPIPHEIERAIANFDFSITEGTARDEPAFIGRIIVSQDQQQLWSVVAIISRGKDEVGRSAPFFRYFFVESGSGEDFIPHILAWFEEYKSKSTNNQYPIFNPFDQKTIGNGLKINITPKSLPQMTNPLLNESTPMIFSFNEYNPAAIHQLSMQKAESEDQENVLAAWAYNVEAVERPGQFTAIRAASATSYNAFLNAKKALAGIQPRVVFDEESVKTALKGITNSPTIKDEHFQDFVKALVDQKVTGQWSRIFNGLGSKNALDRGIYNSQMIKLLILQSVAIPPLALDYVKWLGKSDQKSREIAKTFEEDFFYKVSSLSNPDLAEKVKNQLIEGFGVFMTSLMSDKSLLENLFSKSTVHFLWLEQSQGFINALISDLNKMGLCFQSPSQANSQTINFNRKANKTAPLGSDFTNISNDMNPRDSQMVLSQNIATSSVQQPTKDQRNEAFIHADFELKNEEWKHIRLDIWNFWISRKDHRFLKSKYLYLAEFFERSDCQTVAIIFYDVAQGKVPKHLYRIKSSIYGMPLYTDLSFIEKVQKCHNELFSYLERSPFFDLKPHPKILNKQDLIMKIPVVIILLLISTISAAIAGKYLNFVSGSKPLVQQEKPTVSPANDKKNEKVGSSNKAEQIGILIKSLAQSISVSSIYPLQEKGCGNNMTDSFFKKIDILNPEKDLKDICGIIKNNKYPFDQKTLEKNIQASLDNNNTTTKKQWEILKSKIIDNQRKISQLNPGDPLLDESQKIKINELNSAFQSTDKIVIDINPEIYKLIMQQEKTPTVNPQQPKKGKL